MADVIKKATNKFTRGLVMDFSPENTSNELLTHALNATLVTFNGNELSLQNDMGNARVETAFLPEGYMPVGTCEYGGIIYIVSYNPLENKSQIGCFPSPERNISNDEIGQSNDTIKNEDFVNNGDIVQTSKYVMLRNDKLNPGDKFVVTATDSIYDEHLKDLLTRKVGSSTYNPVSNPRIALNIVSIEDSGKIIYLNSSVRKYEIKKSGFQYKYEMLAPDSKNSQLTPQDIDSYRTSVGSGYSVFKSKSSGKLAILAELVTIDSYDVTYSVQQRYDDDGDVIAGSYDVDIHTSVLPTLTIDNYDYTPKLKYHYLKYSQAQLSLEDRSVVTFFDEGDLQCKNSAFLETTLDKIDSALSTDKLGEKGSFSISRSDTYHGRLIKYTGGTPYASNVQSKFTAEKYHKCISAQIADPETFAKKFDVQFYKKSSSTFTLLPASSVTGSGYIYIKPLRDLYISYDNFEPNSSYNDIESTTEPDPVSPIYLFRPNDYIHKLSGKVISHDQDDLNIAQINIPSEFAAEGLKFPLKYDFTLVPCMDFGKLDHLAVSQTIDFSKLDDFSESKFNTWRYHIDGNQLTLVFGAEVYDTFEKHKVDALFIEFYDMWGFAGSIEVNGLKSYSGTFTRVIALDTYDVLSTKKIESSKREMYVNRYGHNINILEKSPNNFYYNNIRAFYSDDNYGWGYAAGEPTKFDNDCGVLYSNILYGVKAYLRQPTDTKNKYKFIDAGTFFLYTIPIYNDYFYIENNFNNLGKPKVDLQITYKLEDKSDVSVHDSAALYNGYQNYDNHTLEFINGFTEDKSLETVKYYKYQGESNLYVEIGLKEEYNQFNLTYNPVINEYFKCNLSLEGVDGKYNYSVNGDGDYTAEELLNYYTLYDPANTPIFSLSNDNFIKFKETGNSDYVMSKYVKDFNFKTYQGQPIPISYQWVVGYKIDVKNIKEESAYCPTICALFNKNKSGEYNYEDFGIKYDQFEAEEKKRFKNQYVFYNQCVDNTYIQFGVAEQIGVTRNPFPYRSVAQISRNNYTSCSNSITNTYRTLNASLVPNLSRYIGKLAFCMPHVHTMSEESGTNFVYASDDYVCVTTENYFAEEPLTTDYAGVKPTNLAYANAFSSMCCITKGTYYGTEYVVTNGFVKHENSIQDKCNVNWNKDTTKTYYCPLFGISSVYTLDEFNSNLVTTMSSIYGYNPELYPRMVKVGDIYVTDNKVSFNSNVVVSDATLSIPSGKYFSHYIAFGGVSIYDYLSKLKQYSHIKVLDDSGVPMEQVDIQPNLKLCGGESSRVLLTSLTYNTPKPNDINISFDSNVAGAVRHSDGTIVPIKGAANPDVLYGWDDDNKCLVELDVSNYKIDADGTLKLTSLPNDKFSISSMELEPQNLFKLHKSIVSVHIDWGGLTYSTNKRTVTLSGVKKNKEYTIKVQVYLDDQPYPYPLTSQVTLINRSNINVTINDGNMEAKLVINGSRTFRNSFQFSLIADADGDIKLEFNGFDITIDPPNYGPDIKTAFKTVDQWWVFKEDRATPYQVDKSFKNGAFLGSTITVNDLEYEGKNKSHRLFMRDIPISQWEDIDHVHARKIYYRPLKEDPLWTYKNKDLNVLTLVEGPGYDNTTN